MEKSIKINAIFLSLYKLLNIIYPFITSMYLARTLSPTGIGNVTYAQNIVSYFTTVAALGIPNYGIREIAKVAKDRKETSQIFSELFFINMVSTVVCTTVYYFMIICNHSLQEKQLFYVCGLLILFNLFNIDWLYQGEEEYRYIAIRSFIIKIISLITVFLFVKEEKDFIKYALIYCFALGGNYILNILYCKKFIDFIFKGLSWKRHMKSVIIMMATVISVEIYAQLDTTMLGMMYQVESVAYYSYAIKAIRIISTLMSSIAFVLLPRLSYYYANNHKEEFNQLINKVLYFLLTFCLPASIGIFFVSKDIILILYGSSYYLSIQTMQILSPLIWILAIGNLFGTQILVTVGQERKLLYTTIMGAILNIALNLIFIPLYQHTGAAFASVLCELCIMMVQIVWARRYIELKHEKKIIVSIIISLLMLFIFELFVCGKIENIIIDLFLSVFMGMLIYIIMSIITGNELIVRILLIMKEKLTNIFK